MNLNQYTIKAQETIQAAQQLAYAGNNPTIETAHLLKVLLNDQDSPVHYLMKRNNVNVRLLETKLAESLHKLPRITSGEPAQQVGRDLGNVFLKAVNNLKEFKDEFVSMEHLLLALLQVNDDIAAALKAAGLTEKDLITAIRDLRKGETIQSQTQETQYNMLNKYAKNLNDFARQGKL
ncbi:MAG: Clp protease N-terminal domain-containing protein, partial [Sediminibacterium sp.]